MEEKKAPQSVEKSLGYISWSLKELVAELKKVNESLGYMMKFTKDGEATPF
jgi:hypothetical protein